MYTFNPFTGNFDYYQSGGAGGGMAIGGAVTSGTAGSVLFIDGSGNLGQDNSNLFWDNTNKFLGIGTNTPIINLDVNGAIKTDGTALIGKGPVDTSTWTVYGGMNNSQTTVPYYGAPFPDFTTYAMSGVVQVATELIIYTGNTGTSLTGCTRGAFGTSAVSHGNGAGYVVPIAMVAGQGTTSLGFMMSTTGNMSLGSNVVNFSSNSGATLDVTTGAVSPAVFKFWDNARTHACTIYAQAGRLLFSPASDIMEISNEPASNKQGYLNVYGIQVGDYNASNKASVPLIVLPWTSTDVGEIVRGAVSQSVDLTQWQDSSTNILMSVSAGGKIARYNNIATTGQGVPTIYGSGRSTAQTAAVASVATYTVGASDGSFEISANVNVTTATTHNFTITCTYTDETNTSRTLTLNFSNLAGTFLTAITNVTGVGPYEGVVAHIRCRASTAITIATTGTFTAVTYNVESIIKQII